MAKGVVVESYTVVFDTDDSIAGIGRQTDSDGTAIATVLEGVRQKVGDDLVELPAVDPHVELVETVVEEAEVDIALPGVVLEHLADACHKGDKVGLFTVEVHLLLVNLTDVENLVDKVKDALCVTLDGVKVAACLLLIVSKAATEIGQRRHNQCQRRADVLRGVDEEFHLLLVEPFGGTAPIGQEDIGGQRHKDGKIDEVGK